MNRYKNLLKNMGLLTISSFASKLLTFFLVPLYTSCLSTNEYGTYDLFNTTIMLLIPILTLGITDSVLRFPLEKNRSDSEVYYVIGQKYVVYGFLVLIAIICLNNILVISKALQEYQLYFLLMYIIDTIYQLLQNYARGIEKVDKLAVSGVISSFSVITLNIIFLLVFKWGLNGYFLANIIGMLISDLYLIYTLKIYRYMFKLPSDKKLEKSMLYYGVPMILNSISWWINNASDRYIIIGLFGLATNGIYSVSYKIPSIMNMFQTIFNQAWAISAVQEFDPKDSNGFFKNVYSLTNLVMVVSCSLLILSTKILAKILYKNDFYEAWKYVPYLLISVLFGTLTGVLSGVYMAMRASKKFGISTTIGAIANILFSLVLAKLFGPIGPAIGTLISFIIVWSIRLIDIKKFMTIKIKIVRDIASYLILMIQASALMLLSNVMYSYITQIILLIILLVMYKRDIIFIFKKFA